MKKLFLLFILSIGVFQATAQTSCPFTYTVSGNTATFNHQMFTTTLTVVDSLVYNYGDGTPLTNIPLSQTSSSHTYANNGTYNVCHTWYMHQFNQPNTNFVCTFCDSVSIGSPNPCSTTISVSSSGSTVTASGSGSGGSAPYTYAYTLNPGNMSNSTGTFTGLANGVYQVCVTATDNQQNTCSNACASVTVNNNVFCTTSVTVSASGNTVTAVGSATGGTGPFTYSYNLNPGNITNATGVFTGLPNGMYTVCATAGNATQTCSVACDSTVVTGSSQGCLANAAFVPTISGLSASFLNTSNCNGCSSMSYVWNFGDLTPTSTATNPTHTYANPGSYTVCLYMTGVDAQNNTCLDTVCTVINVGNTPNNCIISAAFSESISGLTVNFTDNSTVTGGMILNRNWSYGDMNNGTGTTPSHTYATPGSYLVILVASGIDSMQNPCFDSTSKTITVGPSAVSNVNVQNLNIYPNPTSNDFIIELPANETVEKLLITDVAGRKITSKIGTPKNNLLSVSLENQAFGIYFIKLQTNRQLYTSSIMKQE